MIDGNWSFIWNKEFFFYFLSYYNVHLITKIFHHIPIIDNFICSLLIFVKDFFFLRSYEGKRKICVIEKNLTFHYFFFIFLNKWRILESKDTFISLLRSNYVFMEVFTTSKVYLPCKGIEEVTLTSRKANPCHSGRLHWLETGFTGKFCNEIPQTQS